MENLDRIKRILTDKASREDINSFIVDFVKEKKGKEPTTYEIQGIIQLIMMGVFDLEQTLANILFENKINYIKVFDKTGNIKLKYFYEF